MACFMGIDIGSRTSKGIIVNDGRPKVSHMLASGIDYRETAWELREKLLEQAGLVAGDITRTVATGHGASIIDFSQQHTADIQCCARGINYLFPEARTVIDVHTQCSQAIRLDDKGRVTDFAISEACATGSGGFIEVIANVLQVELDDIGRLSLESENPVTFTTGCAVFGESEAISMVAEGIPKEDILAGVHQALASKIAALITRVGLEEPCAFSGGGALDTGLLKGMENLLGIRLLVPPQPQTVNALGAALIAGDI